MKTQKFGEMRCGQWFKSKSGIILVKLRNELPSGIPIVFNSLIARDIDVCGDGKWVVKEGDKTNLFPITAIDIDGIPRECLDFWEFELIDPPFPQQVED